MKSWKLSGLFGSRGKDKDKGRLIGYVSTKFSNQLEIKDEDCFPFELLPTAMKTQVLSKFNYEDYAVFDQCSKEAYRLCERKSDLKFPATVHETWINDGQIRLRTKFRFYGYTDYVKVRLFLKDMFWGSYDIDWGRFLHVPEGTRLKIFSDSMIMSDVFSNEWCQFFGNILMTKEIRCTEKISCRPALFNALIRKARVQSLLLANDQNYHMYDFTSIAKVSFTTARSLSTYQMFSLKCLYSFEFWQGSFSVAEMIYYVKEWKNLKENMNVTELRMNFVPRVRDEIFDEISRWPEIFKIYEPWRRKPPFVDCWTVKRECKIHPVLFVELGYHYIFFGRLL